MTRARVPVLLAAVIFASSAPWVSAQAADMVTFRSADVLPADTPPVQAVARLDKLLRERTAGRLGIESLGQDSRNSERFTINQVRNGTLDMVRVSIAALHDAVPTTSIFSVPFLFDSRERLRRVLDGPVGDELLADLARTGLIGLCYFDVGAHSFYGKAPIRSAMDLKGFTVRVPPSQTSAAIVRALGATPLQIPYAQVKAALKAGVLDASYDTWSTYVTAGRHQVAGYYSLTEHTRQPSVLVFSKVVWDRLSEQDRNVIRVAAKDTIPYQRQQLDVFEAAARKAAQADGVTVIDDFDKKSFVDALMPIQQKLIQSPELRDLARRIRMLDGATALESHSNTLPLPK